MADAEDAHDAVVESEQDPIVSDAKTQGAGHIAMERHHFASAGAGEMQHAVEDVHGDGTVHATHIGLGFLKPLDSVRRHYLWSGKSSGFRPNSARTSSIGTPWPRCANRAWPSPKPRRSSSVA